jgi:hypothetical protein
MNDATDPLDELLATLLDGPLTERQSAQLAELLREPANMERYTRLMSMHGMLKQTLGTPVAPWAQPVVTSAEPRRPVFGTAAMRIAAAVALVVGVMLGAMSMFDWRGEPSAASALPVSGAVIEQAVEAVWQGGAEDAPRIGAVVSRSLLRLKSGLVRVRFADGSSVVMEGPVEFQVSPAGGGLLQRGRLVYQSTERGKPAVIAATGLLVSPSPRAAVGVQVTGVGRREVHVIDGSAGVMIDEGDNLQSSHKLATGQAIGLDAGGPAKLMTADLETFNRLASLDAAAKAHRAEVYDQWLAYSEQLKRDGDVVAYYRFDHPAGDRRLLRDEVSASGGGAIDGARWVEGRWPQKAALEFTKRTDRVNVVLPQTGDRYTLAAWVKVYGLTNTINVLMHTSMWDKLGQPHWAIRADGRMHLAIHKDALEQPLSPDAQCAISTYNIVGDLGRWVHLAATHDAAAKLTRLYVNGKLDSEHRYRTSHSPQMGAAFIGNWDRDRWNLIGCVDELAVFRRALSDDEVRRMYDVGNPYR